jgi:sugar lactone lactonase YvrE
MRFDLGKTKEVFRTGLSIPNSIGWSPDGKTMYFTHSTSQQVFAYDYNADDGAISNERVFYHHQGTGDPDGFRVDVEGNIWHAIYGEHRVIKISPEGKLVGEIKLPTKNITCTEFVGTVLYITTADDEEGEEESKKYGGGLFRVDVGITGVPPHNFKLDA